MLQNDSRPVKNATIKRKTDKKIFSGSYSCFCPFLVVVGPFSGAKIISTVLQDLE